MKFLLLILISLITLSCIDNCEDITLDLCDCGKNDVKIDSVLIVNNNNIKR